MLAAGAGWVLYLDCFSLPFQSISLWETTRYRLKYCLKEPLSPNQATNQNCITVVERFRYCSCKSKSRMRAPLVLEVKKQFPCSTQLSIKFFLLINVKMPTVVGILTFMSRNNNIIGLFEPEKAECLDIFVLMGI